MPALLGRGRRPGPPTASIVSSRERCVASTTWASAAWVRATPRGSSRRRHGAPGRPASWSGGRRRAPAPVSSGSGGAARASALAVRNTLSVASGQTTVPMSRPSTTMPPPAIASRWSADQPLPHLGHRADRAHRGGHPRLADGVGHVDPVQRDGRGRAGRSRARARAPGARRATRGVVDVDAVVEHPHGHRPVHRAGVEVAQAEAPGDATARRWTCRTRTARRPR